jgi:hypothetical protein
MRVLKCYLPLGELAYLSTLLRCSEAPRLFNSSPEHVYLIVYKPIRIFVADTRLVRG